MSAQDAIREHLLREELRKLIGHHINRIRADGSVSRPLNADAQAASYTMDRQALDEIIACVREHS